MRCDEFGQRPGLRLGERIVTSARLLRFYLPVGGKVAVEIEPVLRRRQRDFDAVVFANQTFGIDAIKDPLHIVKAARHQQPRISIRNFPVATGILNAHRQEQAIAVDILRVQTVALFFVRIHARTAAHPTGICQHVLDAIWTDDGDDIESIFVYQTRYMRLATIAREQQPGEVERRRRSCHFAAVYIAVDVETRFFQCGPRSAICYRQRSYFSPLVAVANRLESRQLGICAHKLAQQFAQLVIAIELAEIWFFHVVISLRFCS